MSKHKYTLGADPELFVKDKYTGIIKPICGLVGGTKSEPVSMDHRLRSLGQARVGHNDFRFQEDNVAFEFNVPVAASADLASDYIMLACDGSSRLLDQYDLAPVFKLTSHEFSDAQLHSDAAKTIGCSPDMVAYSPDGTPAALKREALDIDMLGNWRHTGGHIHFGYDKSLVEDHIFVELVDALVNLPVLALDQQPMRREWYGKAGVYRPKPYGVEYRTFSNFWLQTPYMVIPQCFNLLKDLHTRKGQLETFYGMLPLPRIKSCIDKGITCKADAATQQDILKELHNIIDTEGLHDLTSVKQLRDYIAKAA